LDTKLLIVKGVEGGWGRPEKEWAGGGWGWVKRHKIIVELFSGVELLKKLLEEMIRYIVYILCSQNAEPHSFKSAIAYTQLTSM
jgi:hypothetical protein